MLEAPPMAWLWSLWVHPVFTSLSPNASPRPMCSSGDSTAPHRQTQESDLSWPFDDLNSPPAHLYTGTAHTNPNPSGQSHFESKTCYEILLPLRLQKKTSSLCYAGLKST